MKNKLLLPIFLCLLALPSCSNGKIEHEKLASIYVEILIGQEKYSGNYEALKAERNRIYKKYSVSEADYSQAIDKLAKDPEKWKPFFEQVQHKINNIK